MRWKQQKTLWKKQQNRCLSDSALVQTAALSFRLQLKSHPFSREAESSTHYLSLFRATVD
jgi:uncharacterized protein